MKKEIVTQGFVTVKKMLVQHTLFAGGMSPTISRELVCRYQAAAVLPYDPVNDQVVLIEQFRIGAMASESPWLLELVAGLLDTSERIEEVARRETYEEAGLEVQELVHVMDYWVSPGASDEQVSLYCAKVDATHAGGIHGLAEENEDIRVCVMSTADAYQAINHGKVNNALAIIALQWLQLHQESVKKQWLKK